LRAKPARQEEAKQNNNQYIHSKWKQAGNLHKGRKQATSRNTYEQIKIHSTNRNFKTDFICGVKIWFLFLILFVGSKLGNNNVFYLLAPLDVVISKLKIN
jgi:hypothetical protein